MSEGPDTAIRQHLLDGAKASPVAVYAAGWFWGINWGVLGAFLMAVYSFLLILDKLGALAPLRAFLGRLMAKLFAALQPKSPPPPEAG